MIAKKIDEIIDSVSIKKISLDKKKFEWTNSWGQKFTDGPTKLYIILSFMNPNTRVALNNLKQRIIGAKKLTHSQTMNLCTHQFLIK